MTDRGSRGRRGPLDGVRVLAVEQMQALPFATQLMGYLGAEVVKVEHPVHGDSGRGSLPAVADRDGRQVGATYLRSNLGKKSIALDLKHPEAKQLFLDLVPRFDVVGENFKPGTMDRLGLGYQTLREVHPPLVYVSVSGFGNLGESPYASWPAYAIVAEAMGGLYTLSREPGRMPRLAAAGALGDIGASLFALIGLLSALRHRDQTGEGQQVDVAMFDAMVSLMDMLPFMRSMGVDWKGRENIAGVFDAFPAKDGLFLAQAGREHLLERFARAVGHPEWLEDERFATREGWTEHLDDVVRPAVEAWAADKTRHEASQALADEGLPAGPIFGADDIIGDPHVKLHNMLLAVGRPDGGDPLLVPGNPIKFSELPDAEPRPWPTLGHDTDEILAGDLGLSEAEIAALREQGAIG